MNVNRTSCQLPRGSLKYIDCGTCRWDSGGSVPYRLLPHALFILVEEGRLFLRRNDAVTPDQENHMISALFDMDRQDLFLKEQEGVFLSEAEHHMLYSDTSVTFTWIAFSGDMGVPLENKFVLNDPVPVLQYRAFLQQYIRDAYRLPLCDDLIKLLFGEVWLQQNAVEKSSSQLCAQIREWINGHSDYPVTVNDVADAFSYNVDYITRLFAKYNPEGLKQYIVLERIDRIKYLLLTTDLPIKDIAEQLHFRSYKQFHRFFSYHEHISPIEYRKMFERIDNGRRFI